jgi:hypothetical protein
VSLSRHTYNIVGVITFVWLAIREDIEHCTTTVQHNFFIYVHLHLGNTSCPLSQWKNYTIIRTHTTYGELNWLKQSKELSWYMLCSYQRGTLVLCKVRNWLSTQCGSYCLIFHSSRTWVQVSSNYLSWLVISYIRKLIPHSCNTQYCHKWDIVKIWSYLQTSSWHTSCSQQ